MPLQRAKRGLRTWWHRKPLQLNQAVFDDPVLCPILANDPNHGLRVLRPYLIRGLDAAGRAQTVADHFGFLRRHIKESALYAIYLQGLCLTQRDTRAGQLKLMLYDSLGLGREGELRMAVELNGQPLHMFAITVVMPQRIGLPADDRPVLWIGCNKGPNPEPKIPDLIKQATKAMQGLRPKALMLHGAQALAAGWGLAGLYGVANQGTVFAGYYHLRDRIKADYDRFWQEYDGQAVTPYVYRLAAEPVAKDLASVASNKRAAAARKIAAARQWFDDAVRSATVMRAG